LKKSFTSTLIDIRGGALVEEATTDLSELVAAVQDSGKGGKIVVTIEIKPFAKVADAVEVVGKCVVTLPREKETAEVFFPTVENNLSRNSSRQPDLPGIVTDVESRDVESDKPVRDIGSRISFN
jgi:hypothetical protein